MENVIIWKDSRFIIERKMLNIKKIGKRVRRSFCKDYGDIPVFSSDDTLRNFKRVSNRRGNAYALRNALRYRKGKYLKTKYKCDMKEL